jgi:iron-sulfur cluster assembly protein
VDVSHEQGGVVLRLTDRAIMVIRTLTAEPGTPKDAGLRIAHEDEAGFLGMRVAAEPTDGDQIVEAGGVRVFLEPGAAAMLDGKSLDALPDATSAAFQVCSG